MPQEFRNQPEASNSVRNSFEAEVRQTLDAFAEAIAAGKLDAIIDFYAPEVVAFDMMPPIAVRGRDAYRHIWQEFFTSYFKFPIETGYRDQKIMVDGDNAIAFGLISTKARAKDGSKIETLMRNTTVLQRRAQGWKIVHEHNSVPIDGLSGKGLMNLKTQTEFATFDPPTSANRGIDD